MCVFDSFFLVCLSQSLRLEKLIWKLVWMPSATMQSVHRCGDWYRSKVRVFKRRGCMRFEWSPSVDRVERRLTWNVCAYILYWLFRSKNDWIFQYGNLWRCDKSIDFFYLMFCVGLIFNTRLTFYDSDFRLELNRVGFTLRKSSLRKIIGFGKIRNRYIDTIYWFVLLDFFITINRF